MILYSVSRGVDLLFLADATHTLTVVSWYDFCPFAMAGALTGTKCVVQVASVVDAVQVFKKDTDVTKNSAEHRCVRIVWDRELGNLEGGRDE